MQSAIQDKLTLYLRQEGLPLSLLDLLDWFYLPLVDHITAMHRSSHPLLLGINGAQGSGKSTLAAVVAMLLREQHGLCCASLSLDDLYLTRAERQALADKIHPLFITRGVPGTHDIKLGNKILDQVLAGQSLLLPRFDKLRDDRADKEQWPEYPPLDVLLLEGWCVGCRPQNDTTAPINRLEQEEDPGVIWRNYVNTCLQEGYATFFSRVHSLLMLAVPSMDKVYEWRELQEQKLQQIQGSRGMNKAEVRRFIMHYERLTKWMLQEMPQRADILIPIGDDHAPKEYILRNSG